MNTVQKSVLVCRGFSSKCGAALLLVCRAGQECSLVEVLWIQLARRVTGDVWY